MRKLFLKSFLRGASNDLLRCAMLLLCALIVGSSSLWADTTVATFDSDVIVDNSAYANTYGGDDWSINMGGNNRSIGFNNKNCVTIGNALGTSANASNYGVVVKSKNAFTNINKITFVYTAGSGDGGNIYLAYSTNGSSWSAITLNSGSGLSAQGATVSQNTTLTFEFNTIASAYYAFILDKGNTTKAAYRFDYVTVNFINVPASSSTASTPTFLPAAGELTKAQNITVSSTGAAKIIYTTNGDEPTIGGATTTTVNAASASVLVSTNMTVKAKGVDSSNEPTTMATASYTINLAEPVILPAERTYTTTTNVSFTQADNIDVYYTLDGTTPTSGSTKYNGTPFAITENITVKAITIDAYDNASDVVEAIFKNTEIQANPVTIQMTNSLFGEDVHTSGKSTSNLTFTGYQDNVKVTYYVPNDSYYYFNTSNTRPYDTNTITYGAPSGYVITKIVFTSDGSNWKDATPSCGTMTSTKQWEGCSSSVSFDWSVTGTRIKTVVVTLAQEYTRTVTADNWGTICLPYAVSAGDIEGATFYSIIGKDETNVYLESVSALVAGKPYIFQASASSLTLALNFAESAASVAGSDNGLHGTFVDVDFKSPFDEENTYIIYNNQVRKASDKSGVDAYRAYIEIDEIVGGAPAAPGRPIIQMPYESNNATDIQNIETKDDAIKFIENGQLFIKKNNGVVYDVLGRIIK